ncbi:MAG: alpha/beta hydrolase [Pseudomonadota bacterium]
MEPLDALFPDFEHRRIRVGDTELNVRIGGSGPPLLCLHGYPQTQACWHRVAPPLADVATLVLIDLPGYGNSDKPPATRGHESYAKRTVASDCVALMQSLGFPRFSIMGHDRGARVAYRLSLDTPAAVERLIVLDIVPTIEVWDAFGAGAANRSYHWTFLAQEAPLPETLIAGAPRAYIDMTLARWTQDKSLDAFDPAALESYRALFDDAAGITAVCEDYRAGATIDAVLDAQDRAAGTKIAAPTLFLWGSNYLGQGQNNPLPTWERWCTEVRGAEVTSGHFLVEENPEAVLDHVVPFLTE